MPRLGLAVANNLLKGMLHAGAAPCAPVALHPPFFYIPGLFAWQFSLAHMFGQNCSFGSVKLKERWRSWTAAAPANSDSV